MKTFDQFNTEHTNEDFKSDAMMICMSHLSDAQEMTDDINMLNKLNFVKKLIMDCKGDLKQIIDPDIKWQEFQDSKFFRK